jgi:phosphoribosylformylglycinamidine cyclo-ligase
MLPRDDMAAGDVLLGLASSGVHSNGFSLVRKAVALRGLDLADDAPFQPGTSLGRALIEPTRIYVKSCLAAIRGGGVKALCHITGGGLIENIPRILPDHLTARLRAGSWEVPGVFSWLAKGHQGSTIAAREMARTFNCGVGMVLVAAPGDVDKVTATLEDAGETVTVIGELLARDTGDALVIDGLDSGWLTD